MDQAATEIIRAGKVTWPDDGWWGISPYMVPGVLWSLDAFLKTQGVLENHLYGNHSAAGMWLSPPRYGRGHQPSLSRVEGPST